MASLRDILESGLRAELGLVDGPIEQPTGEPVEQIPPVGVNVTDRDTGALASFQQAVMSVSQNQILMGTLVIVGIIGVIAVARKVF